MDARVRRRRVPIELAETRLEACLPDHCTSLPRRRPSTQVQQEAGRSRAMARAPVGEARRGTGEVGMDVSLGRQSLHGRGAALASQCRRMQGTRENGGSLPLLHPTTGPSCRWHRPAAPRGTAAIACGASCSGWRNTMRAMRATRWSGAESNSSMWVPAPGHAHRRCSTRRPSAVPLRPKPPQVGPDGRPPPSQAHSLSHPAAESMPRSAWHRPSGWWAAGAASAGLFSYVPPRQHHWRSCWNPGKAKLTSQLLRHEHSRARSLAITRRRRWQRWAVEDWGILAPFPLRRLRGYGVAEQGGVRRDDATVAAGAAGTLLPRPTDLDEQHLFVWVAEGRTGAATGPTSPPRSYLLYPHLAATRSLQARGSRPTRNATIFCMSTLQLVAAGGNTEPGERRHAPSARKVRYTSMSLSPFFLRSAHHSYCWAVASEPTGRRRRSLGPWVGVAVDHTYRASRTDSRDGALGPGPGPGPGSRSLQWFSDRASLCGGGGAVPALPVPGTVRGHLTHCGALRRGAVRSPLTHPAVGFTWHCYAPHSAALASSHGPVERVESQHRSAASCRPSAGLSWPGRWKLDPSNGFAVCVRAPGSAPRGRARWHAHMGRPGNEGPHRLRLRRPLGRSHHGKLPSMQRRAHSGHVD